MAYDWKDYFELAKELEQSALDVNKSYTDACHRSSISRAYYSAYNIALNVAKSLGYTYPNFSPNRGNHADLADFLRQFPDDQNSSTSFGLVRIIGGRLKSCRSNRNKTDYRDNISRLPRLNQITISKVDEILRICSK